MPGKFVCGLVRSGTAAGDSELAPGLVHLAHRRERICECQALGTWEASFSGCFVGSVLYLFALVEGTSKTGWVRFGSPQRHTQLLGPQRKLSGVIDLSLAALQHKHATI